MSASATTWDDDLEGAEEWDDEARQSEFVLADTDDGAEVFYGEFVVQEGVDDDADAEPYSEEPRDDGRSLGSDHWLGGLATGVQGHTPEEGTVLLLHLSYDSELGFEFLDGGVLQFRIPADALAERDFARVSSMADSC